MRRFTVSALILALVGLAGAQPLQAQKKGIGGFLDWINRLSGPRMVGPAVTVWVAPWEGEVLRLRMSVARRSSRDTDDSPLPAGTDIDMRSFTPAVEFRLAAPLAIGGGVAINRFSGDFDEDFTHLSYPVYAQLRLPAHSRFQVVVSAGGQYFPEFDGSAFDPIPGNAGVSTDGGELTCWFGAGFEFVWH